MRAKANALGFEACRVTSAIAPENAGKRLAAWLGEGAHGDMAWMAGGFERRVDPRVLMPDAKSLVMLGLNYGPSGDPLAVLGLKDAGAISIYARHRDYHDVVKGKLKQLAAFVVASASRGRRTSRCSSTRLRSWKSRWPRAPGLAGRASTPTSSPANSGPGSSSAPF